MAEVAEQAVPAKIKRIRPLGDRILVRRIEESETTKGGIFIPDGAREKPQEGEVVATGRGTGTASERNLINPGDRILFGKYAGSELKVNGETLLIMTEAEVLGVVEE